MARQHQPIPCPQFHPQQATEVRAATQHDLYLIAGSDILIRAIDMHTFGNVWALLFETAHETTSFVVETLKRKK
jgi:hypothetical protein